MLTAPTVWKEPPRSTRPPFSIKAPPLPRLPPPEMATRPPLICVAPI